MKRTIALSVAMLLFCCACCVAGTDPGVLGSWTGESKCTVPDSPCHDEIVLYQISTDKKNAGQLNVEAYKIVNGVPDFMGALVCQFHAEQSMLVCSGNSKKQDIWEFHLSGDTLTGTLTIGSEKTLYRRIRVHRKRSQ
jgi:hypothetical protein